MKRSVLLVAPLVLLIGVRQASAGVLAAHAQVLADFSTTNDTPGVVSSEGNGSLDTGLQNWQAWNVLRNGPDTNFNTIGELKFTPPDAFDHVNGTLGGSSRAITNPQAANFLRAYASAFAFSSGGFDASAQAAGAWQDVAFANVSGHPEIRLNFSVDAVLSGQQQGNNSFSELGISTSNGAQIPWQQLARVDPSNGFSGISAGLAFDGSSVGTGWDSVSFNSGVLHGTFHIDSLYDPTLGGYGWGVQLRAIANATAGGTVTVDALDTMSLQSVTLTDGTPVSGVTFDSGLTFGPGSATPEPTTLTLLAIGIAGIAGYGWRRRK